MISFVKGKLVDTFDGGIIIENANIGYQIFVPDNSSIYLKKENEEVKVYTALIVREDDMSLYGFSNMAELKMFRLLTTVNGIGAKAGLSILSSMPLEQIQIAILNEDVISLTKANGIGKKTAQRIVLELKDKIAKENIVAKNDDITMVSSNIKNSLKDEAIEALISLGYTKFEATDVISKIKNNVDNVEDIIKLALKKI